MANYKESTISGNKWQRCCRVVISNVYGRTPIIEFVEEAAFSDGASVVTNQLGRISTPFDPLSEIQLLDIDTGIPTGQTITHLDMYKYIFSLYMQQATIRDNQQQEQ